VLGASPAKRLASTSGWSWNSWSWSRGIQALVLSMQPSWHPPIAERWILYLLVPVGLTLLGWLVLA
jgi:hypothetical protein